MDQLLAKMNNNGAVPLPAAPPTGMVTSVYDRIEMLFDALGLMRGTFAPMKRFVFGGGIALIIMMAYQPKYAFSRGQIRPHVWMAGDSPVPSTWIPFWVPPLLTGLFLALFI